ARSGKLRWKWEPIVVPKRGADGSSSKAWRTGAGNAWSIMTVDAERHLIFVPTGSASPDYYGGLRSGGNKWANPIVALRAPTGAARRGLPACPPCRLGPSPRPPAAAGHAPTGRSADPRGDRRE